ncbi:pre-mRNA-splicing factor sap145-like [Lotus japonicus]|uniref:pre-mRNA-splicing factor sap145-like n=1 Tax=Lotus japonicus TaxID=34305 RepID=UPI00258B508F|nr:pre-mRNA-splicing factor sap145-like [Lotus japonicus]XP_057454762.1 pre-mRNA-splicing factor sap145-like [Lotus japonicus]
MCYTDAGLEKNLTEVELLRMRRERVYEVQRKMDQSELEHDLSGLDVWDATASDPKLLGFLKSYSNTVPMPRHWSQKRVFAGERLWQLPSLDL